MEIPNNQIKPTALDSPVLTKASAVKAEINVVDKMAEEQAQAKTESTTNTPDSVIETKPEELETAVAQINDYMQNLERSLQFTIDDASGKDVVTVLDKNTEEVIRQFPSEEALVIARQIVEQKDDDVNLFSSQV